MAPNDYAVGTTSVSTSWGLGTIDQIDVPSGDTINLPFNLTVGALGPGAGTIDLDGNTLTIDSTDITAATFDGAIADGSARLRREVRHRHADARGRRHLHGRDDDQPRHAGNRLVRTRWAPGPVTLNDANTGNNNTALLADFPLSGTTMSIPNNITVAKDGTGTATLGTAQFTG